MEGKDYQGTSRMVGEMGRKKSWGKGKSEQRKAMMSMGLVKL